MVLVGWDGSVVLAVGVRRGAKVWRGVRVVVVLLVAVVGTTAGWEAVVEEDQLVDEVALMALMAVDDIFFSDHAYRPK